MWVGRGELYPIPDDHDGSAFVVGVWLIWRSFSCWLVGLVIFFYLVRRIEGIGGTVHCFSEKQTAAEGRGRCKITPEVIVILAAWLDKRN